MAGCASRRQVLDDPHIERDRYETIAGRPNPLAQLRLGLTHSPSRVSSTRSPTTATTS
jgi:hypothetical protein